MPQFNEDNTVEQLFIDTLKKNQENRQYIPRVIKDLKCAKKELK